MLPPQKSGDASQYRIAFLNSSLPPGGGTVFLVNLVGELVRRGIPAEVLSSLTANPLAADFARQNIPVIIGKSDGLIFEDRVLRTLRNLARFAPNVVVANVDHETADVLRHLPPGVNRIGVVHAFCQIEMAATYARAMDRVVGMSQHVLDLVAQTAAFQPQQIRHIAMGFPIPASQQRESPMTNRPLRILYLGRLDEPAKRVRLFPTILRQLQAAQIPFSWTIAGEGEEEPFLRSHLVTGNASQLVRFTGFVPYADVPGLLASHDIMLVTSDTETFSLSLHEGMAAGMVPVASDLPGPVRNSVAPGAGILVPPDKVEGYADAIIWLHEHRDEMPKMSAKARAVIGREHSVEAMTDRWLELLSPTPPGSSAWPARWRLLSPLHSAPSWRFSAAGRMLRRTAAKANRVYRKRFKAGR